MDDHGAGVWCFILPFAIIVIVSIVWHFSRSKSLFETWAAANNYRIISSGYRTLFKGAFFWTTSEGQTVYRVTVEDAHGRYRSGYLRCGSWLGGLLSSKVEVRWDDEG